MAHIPTEEEIKEMYNLDDEGFKKAAMTAVALEVLEKIQRLSLGRQTQDGPYGDRQEDR